MNLIHLITDFSHTITLALHSLVIMFVATVALQAVISAHYLRHHLRRFDFHAVICASYIIGCLLVLFAPVLGILYVCQKAPKFMKIPIGLCFLFSLLGVVALVVNYVFLSELPLINVLCALIVIAVIFLLAAGCATIYVRKIKLSDFDEDFDTLKAPTLGYSADTLLVH